MNGDALLYAALYIGAWVFGYAVLAAISLWVWGKWRK